MSQSKSSPERVVVGVPDRLVEQRREISLPEIEVYRFLASHYRPMAIFETAYLDWQALYNHEDSASNIETLCSAGDMHDEADHARVAKEIEWLKQTRRAGTKLADAWKMLSHNHKAPEKFEKVVTTIGDFKDVIWHQGDKAKIAAKLMGRIEDLNDAKIDPFVPASQLSFSEYYNDVLDQINSLISDPDLTLYLHHRLRRRIRTIRNFYGLMAKTLNLEEARTIYDFLSPVSTEMGKQQDQFLVMEIKGKVEVNEHTTVVDPRHEELITKFLSFHLK